MSSEISKFTNLYWITSDKFIGVGTKNYRSSNLEDASVGAVAFDTEGECIWNKAWTDNPASNYLRTLYDACLLQSSLIIPITKWNSNYSYGEMGFMSVDVNSGSLNSTKVFSAYKSENLSGVTSLGNYIFYLTISGKILKFSTTDTKVSMGKTVPNFSTGGFGSNNYITTDGTYLYFTTNSSRIYKIDIDGNVVLSKNITFKNNTLGNLWYYDHFLYVRFGTYLLILTQELEAVMLIQFNNIMNLFRVENGRFIYVYYNADTMEVFNFPVESLFKVFDLKVNDHRITRKNTRLLSISDVTNITFSDFSTPSISNASVSNEAGYTISDENISNVTCSQILF